MTASGFFFPFFKSSSAWGLAAIAAETAAAIAEAGVDLISAGWLTHSVTVLDVGLDYVDGAAAS